MKEGLRAFESERLEEAERALREVFDTDPSFVDAEAEGSAAYWLGLTYWEQDRGVEALAVWRAGVQAGFYGGSLDIQSADAYIGNVYGVRRADRYEEAQQLYLLLLAAYGTPLTEGEAAVLERHVAQAELVVPERERASRRGAALARWWSEQDPLPATPVNERLSEHLERVAFAEQQYAHRGATGFDDRGAVYVRLGAPTIQDAVDFYTPRIVQKINDLRRSMGNNLLISPGDFADNEFWLYDGSEPYYYLFVRKSRGFQIGETKDLIPLHLQGGVEQDTGRGGAKADILLEAFLAIYEQLAPYHLDFGMRYNRVDEYLGRVDEVKVAYEQDFGGEIFYSADKRSDNSAFLQQEGVVFSGIDSPDIAVRRAIAEARREDEVARFRRDERVPPHVSQVLDALVQIPVAVRAARFLEPDGTTRTEVYWALNGDDGRDLDAFRQALFVDIHARHLGPGGEARYAQRLVIPDRLPGRAGVVAPQQGLVVPATGGRYGLHLQWDLCTEDAAAVEGRACFRTAVARLDSLSALTSVPGRLEMSDLVPVLDGPGLYEEPATSTPYPFGTLTPQTQLALLFEVYGLSYGADDETAFTIAYEVRKKREGRFLARDRTETAAVEIPTTSPTTTSREVLALDPANWAGADEVVIEVTVTDEATGRSVMRSLTFRVEDVQG